MRWSIGVLLDSTKVKTLILALSKRSEDAKIELIDAAYWVKGCSSLGKLRYAALVKVIDGRKEKMALIDIKEAVASAAPASKPDLMPTHAGERVVAGARATSPNLGDRMASGDLSNRPVVVRELMPEDMKLDIEQFTRKEAVSAARYLASVVGKAHGRQMSADDRRLWLRRTEGTTSAGPSRSDLAVEYGRRPFSSSTKRRTSLIVDSTWPLPLELVP